jgi:Cu-Zn family superoxide dismutase
MEDARRLRENAMLLRQFVMTTALTLAGTGYALAAEATVVMNAIDANGVGKTIGALSLTDASDGLRIAPKLEGLAPGDHGFHVHVNADCGAAAGADGKMAAGLAAGGHYDPAGAGKHLGPQGAGHKGDLPFLTVAADGKATTPVVARHLKLADVKGRSFMVHAGGDNYADQPAPLGGGGARVACGVLK